MTIIYKAVLLLLYWPANVKPPAIFFLIQTKDFADG